MATLAQFERAFVATKSDSQLRAKLGITQNEAHALASKSRARLGSRQVEFDIAPIFVSLRLTIRTIQQR